MLTHHNTHHYSISRGGVACVVVVCSSLSVHAQLSHLCEVSLHEASFTRDYTGVPTVSIPFGKCPQQGGKREGGGIVTSQDYIGSGGHV